jgi:thiamine pyrophosphokinase
MDLLVIAESIPICNTLPLKNRQVVGKAIALPYIGRHCLPNDKSQFVGFFRSTVFLFWMGYGRMRKKEKRGRHMKTCVIFCAGEFQELSAPVEADQLVIAADGGLAHLQKLGLKPHIILGDFDSLGYVPEGAEVYPVEKDDTDTMLAIKKGLALGCDRFYIYGALDGKWVDHTMANFQALQYLAERGARGWLMGSRQIVTAICNDKLILPPSCYQELSIFCMGKDARGVSIRGMKYELEDGVLTSSFPLAARNQFIQKTATVEVKDGTLLLIWHRENGIL